MLLHLLPAAYGRVWVLGRDPLHLAGSWQVVVIATVGVVSGDGGEGVQRQVLVEQTARQAERERRVENIDTDSQRDRQVLVEDTAR